VTLTSWDEFLWPLIIVGARDLQTAPLAMSQLQSQYLTPFNYLLVVAALMVLPPFVAFLFVQREVIETVGQTGIK
jgi:ABC-type glycerol-3-phosphate transport system permease component